MPEVLWLECDHGAEWPTWVTAAGEPPGSVRTDYRPLDDVPVSDGLRQSLFAWQQTWEELVWPPDVRHDIDPEAWAGWVRTGADLAPRLQAEVGDCFEVRCRFEPEPEH